MRASKRPNAFLSLAKFPPSTSVSNLQCDQQQTFIEGLWSQPTICLAGAVQQWRKDLAKLIWLLAGGQTDLLFLQRSLRSRSVLSRRVPGWKWSTWNTKRYVLVDALRCKEGRNNHSPIAHNSTKWIFMLASNGTAASDFGLHRHRHIYGKNSYRRVVVELFCKPFWPTPHGAVHRGRQPGKNQ